MPEETHFFPLHDRGPIWDGCTIENLSLANAAGVGFNQRSGMNSLGWWKFSALWYAAHWKMATFVYETASKRHSQEVPV